VVQFNLQREKNWKGHLKVNVGVNVELLLYPRVAFLYIQTVNITDVQNDLPASTVNQGSAQ